MSLKLSIGCLVILMASHGRSRNNFVQTTIEKKVEANIMVSGALITNQIADSASRKRVMSYIVKDKQKEETRINNIMIESNKETLKKANEAITNGDYEKFLSFCTDDTKWIFVADETLEGKEAVRRYMTKAYLEPPKFKVDNLIGEGDFVTAVGNISLKDENGKIVHYSYCDVWRFRAGKMAELKAYVIEMK
jgi:ketosteroid isomerase-like protein